MPCEHTASILPARTQTVSLLLWDMSTCLCSSSVFILKGRIVVRILAFFHLFISVISYLVLLLQYTFVFSGHVAISRSFHCDRIIPGTLVLPTGGNKKTGPGVTWLRRNEERATRKMGGGAFNNKKSRAPRGSNFGGQNCSLPGIKDAITGIIELNQKTNVWSFDL